MNQPEVRCRIGTQPNTCSKNCVTPTTLKPLDATSSSDSSARPEPVPSVRTIRSGRCASTMSERSAIFPSTGTPSVGEACSASSTMPTTLNGTSAACSALSARSLAQLLVPTTSTRRFAANCRRQAASQSVDRLKTETAISASVDSASSAPSSGSQKLSAETTTRPVKVPTAEGTAAPNVNGTARNALRTVKTQTAATSEETATARECRGHLREGEHEDRHPDRRRPTDLGRAPRVDPSEQVVEERRQLARRRPDREFPRVMHMSRQCPSLHRSIYPSAPAVSPCPESERVPSLSREAHRTPRSGGRGQVLARPTARRAPRRAGDPPRPALLEAGLGRHAGCRVAGDPAPRARTRLLDRRRHPGGKDRRQPLAGRSGRDRVHGRLAADVHLARHETQARFRRRAGDARRLQAGAVLPGVPEVPPLHLESTGESSGPRCSPTSPGASNVNRSPSCATRRTCRDFSRV